MVGCGLLGFSFLPAVVIFCFDDGSGLDLGDEADFRFLTVAQQVGMATVRTGYLVFFLTFTFIQSEYIFARPHPGFSTNIERATQNLQKMNNAEKNFYLDRIVGDLGLGDESRSSQTYVKPEWYLVKVSFWRNVCSLCRIFGESRVVRLEDPFFLIFLLILNANKII